uniref:Uncharacterized protein n=1 Tax=Rhinolophus ferrumequinum TaxID=59479 RepID=A0A671DYV0_RHIFE
MEDSHRSDTSETAPQPGSTVQGGDISHIAQQGTLPLPQMEPCIWPVQAQMESRDFDINHDTFRQYSARYNNAPVCTDF